MHAGSKREREELVSEGAPAAQAYSGQVVVVLAAALLHRPPYCHPLQYLVCVGL